MESDRNYEPKSPVFIVGFTIAQILGIISIVLTVLWTNSFLGGYAWQSNPPKQFNYHPLLMVIGLIFFYGDAILVYRVLRNQQKLTLKWFHAVLHLLAFIFTVIALQAVFDFHNLIEPPIANMYTLHSWIGLATVIMFTMQFVCGFISFLIPALSPVLKAKYLPLHVFFGVVIFAMAIASALMGITEKLLFTLAKDYQNLPNHALVANCLGVMIVSYGIAVAYLVVTPQFKRKPLPEEAMLAMVPQPHLE